MYWKDVKYQEALYYFLCVTASFRYLIYSFSIAFFIRHVRSDGVKSTQSIAKSVLLASATSSSSVDEN